MNILIDTPPTSVTVCGEELEIDSSFRTGILFESLVNEDLDFSIIVDTALQMYYGENVIFATAEAVQEAVEKMLWFYRCGDEREIESDGDDSTRSYSFDYDAEYIYQAFRETYHIDLRTEELHWWVFRALFKALPEDCMFMKIVGYRTLKIPQKMDKEQKQFYQKMKKVFRLPAEIQHGGAKARLHHSLEEALMNGEDPTAILQAMDNQ